MNQADETGARLSGHIAESRTRLLAGESPAAIADDLQDARLSTIEMMLVCMRATGGSLGDVKLLGQWWREGRVTDAVAFDEAVRSLVRDPEL